jgi:heat shock protein HtpX
MANRIKTYFLLGLLTISFVLIGSFFGKNGMLIAFIIAIALNWVSYFFSDRIILSMYRAKELDPSGYPAIHRIVEELSITAKLPKPRIYLIPTATPNAFATGRDPEHAAVAVTEGILNLLDENELKGVLAHELTHVKNRDILIATIAATIAGAITLLARMLQWSAILGGMGDDDNAGGILGLAGILLFAIIAPIAALIIQLAISRSREYMADQGGAKIAGNPIYLANALEKLSQGIKQNPMNHANPSTSHLFIVSPFTKKSFVTLFSTHPPVEERIKRLKNMAG